MIGTRLLERYELTNELGRGGMGVVYRAWDPMLNRQVAVKMVPPSSLSRKVEERFQREAQVVAQMDHPGIVPIHDFGRHEGSLFFVMPWVQGTLLQALLREGSPVLDDTLEIGVQVAEALDYTHSQGVVHRDVKPGNVMVSREGRGLRVRVMDFGVARGSAQPRLTGTGDLTGTLIYSSPEQVASAQIDGRSDIYSLGTVLYECLAGVPPFTGAAHSVLYRIAHEYPQPLGSRGVEVDEELGEIILRCLEKDPSGRPQRGKELSAALRDYRRKLRESGGTQSSAALPKQAIRTRRLPPLAGREDELAELQRRLNAALAGECQWVLVGGEAGTGKSRLLQELEYLARVRRIRVLRGRFADRQSAIPYHGLCELIQDYFRATETGSSTPATQPSGATPPRTPPPDAPQPGTPPPGTPQPGTPQPDTPDLSDLAADLLALFPMLSEIRALRSAAGDAALERPPAERPADLFELLARTLIRLAAGKPAVLLLENLHAGDGSLEALQYVVRRLGPTPTLVVGTYRQTEIDRGHPLARMLRSFNDDPRFCSIVLGPLRADEFRELVEIEVGSSELRKELVERLYEVTEGNPYFGRELVRSLTETGGLGLDDSGFWGLSGEVGISTDALPATIQQAVERRIERLTPEHQEILSLASVLGRSFSFRDLEELAGKSAEPDQAIDELIRQGILQEDRKSRGDQLSFTSGVVRDVLYHELSRRKRRLLHRRCAEQLEKRFATRLERVYPRLVHHFSEGDVPDKTVRYALEQARTYLEAFSCEDAIRTAATALEFVADDEVEDPQLAEGELVEIVAAAHRAMGNIAKALKEAERAAAAFVGANAPGKAAAAILLAAETAWQGRRVEETRRFVNRGAELAHRGGATEILRRLLILGATVANLRGEYRQARRNLEEAEELAPPSSGEAEEAPLPVGGTLTVALPNPVAHLDPAELNTDEEAEVNGNIFHTLLAADADGNLFSSLCQEWEGSEDGKTFVLTLRPDVRFSDGSLLTAREVKASLKRIVSQRSDNPLAVLAPIAGLEAFLSGRVGEIHGIEILGSDPIAPAPYEAERLVFHLVEPLPILPVLLTNPKTAVAREVVREEDETVLLGTGPFRIAPAQRITSAGIMGRSRPAEPGAPERILLERNPSYRRSPPLESIELRTSLDASGIAAGLRSGDIDVGSDLLPEDLEEILRDPRFRSGLHEVTKKNVYFVLFNHTGPTTRDSRLRRALVGVVRTPDLIWRALGRFAQPAVSFLPPGILGHDPGRRHRPLAHGQALELLQAAGLTAPIRLRAAVHPLLQDRYGSLTTALFSEWSALGVEISIATPTMESYLAHAHNSEGMDLVIGRWNAEYDDPDSFTYCLFHSRVGLLRRYYSSPEADRLLERARQESQSAARQVLYQRFEGLLERQSALLPLFHDVDYRIVSPRVRGLRLRHVRPYVDYSQVGKTRQAPGTAQAAQAPAVQTPYRLAGRGEIHVPVRSRIETLDPTHGNVLEHLEVTSNVFETLTGIDEGVRIVPWLAASFEFVDGSYRFRLREKVRFHDGRRLTARDVRYSFERLLRAPENELRFLLSPVRGARALSDGEATELSGFRILSATEFHIDLERPFSLFPALLAHAGLGIVPEDCQEFRGRWREGCAGTGPFRVVRFDRGERLDLEKNPHYWRADYPLSDRLVFHFGISPERILADFRSGRLALALHLSPSDVEALRRDPEFAGSYHEFPRLSTCFLVLNARRGPFSDPELRRSFARALDADVPLRETVGPGILRAHGLIPPGLPGYELPRSSPRSDPGEDERLRGIHLKASVHPAFADEYAEFWARLRRSSAALGLTVEAVERTTAELVRVFREGTADLVAARWVADYPDSDAFAVGLLHSREGLLAEYCSSPEIDRLIAKGRSEIDSALRHSIYREIEEIIARDRLLVPLFHEQTYRFCHPSIGGLRLGLGMPEVRYDELRARG
ncbi:MAG: protein kinase [bacterium]|nr:protein kinase [bacterium]